MISAETVSAIKDIVLLVLTLGAGIVGWFVRMLWELVDRTRHDISVLSSEMSKTYVRREDYREDIRDVKRVLNDIWRELKDKQDRPGT